MSRDFYHTGLEVSRSEVRTLIDGMGPGDHFYVDYEKGADGHDGNSWGRALRTYSEAIRRVTSNNNDVIHIDGNQEIMELGMVTLDKNRVHIVGHNGALGHYGPGARINIGLTTDVLDIALFKNTGVRNTFTGIKFSSNNTKDIARHTVHEAGEYARYRNCEIVKISHLADGDAADLLLQGDSAQFYETTIGVSSLPTVGAVRRPNVLCYYLAGKRPKDVLFRQCLFPKMAGNAAAMMVYITNTQCIERWIMFDDCTFINNVAAAADPNYAVGVSGAQTVGVVILKNCTSILCDLMVQGAVGIYTAGPVPTAATSGIAVTA